VNIHGGDFILLDLSDQQRAKHVAEGDDKGRQCAQGHSLFQVRAWFSGLGGGVSWVS
jgi:hypothetical protein